MKDLDLDEDTVSSTVTMDEDDKNSNTDQRSEVDEQLEYAYLKQLRPTLKVESDAAEIVPSVSSSDRNPRNVGEKSKSIGNPGVKGKKTSNPALLKGTKKQKLEEEKAAKKTANDMNKIYKPGECMKYMNVEGHPSLWSRWYMADVSREVSAVGAHVVQANALCDPALIVWTRSLPRSLQANAGQVKLSPSLERCDRALYIASADELCALYIASADELCALYVASADELCALVSSHTLATHLGQIQQLCDCKLTLLVFQVNEYFKSTGRKTSNSNRSAMTEIEFELAITDLLVSAGCDTVIANTPNELALTIVQFTKAIAEAPFKKAKRACDEQAEFYMRGDNKKCVAVDKDGVGVGRVWQQMIAVLPQSSLETSRALCALYQSPFSLFSAFQCSTTKDDIANIGVSRAAVAGARARRIGPEFARKLHTLFTATSGDVLIE